MEENESLADIPGVGKQFKPLPDEDILDYGLGQFPVDGRRGYISALPMGGGLPERNYKIDVPDEVPVKIGDQEVGVARTKQTPEGITFEMEMDPADWVETKRGWIGEHLVKPPLPADFSYESAEPPRFLRPYMEYRVPPIIKQIPSRIGGDMLNPDPFDLLNAKPGEPRPEPEPDNTEDSTSGE